MSDFETLLKEVGAIVATEHDKGELSFRVPGDFDILVLKIVTKVNDLFTPAPCNMTHTEPFDFAQCETHDTTFPLGGTCKFNGREIWEVYADEADEQRQRAVRHEFDVARDLEALRGDLHHLINPIIGTLRLAEHKGDWTHIQQRSDTYIDRLYLALALVDEAVVGDVVPDERRGKHGVGLNHYPSLRDPDASPCVSPHEEPS